MPDTLEPTGSGRYPPDTESRVAVLEQIARSLLSGQERIERRFDVVDRRFDAVDRRFDAVDRRIDMLGAKQNADFCWLLGIMAHGFHWL